MLRRWFRTNTRTLACSPASSSSPRGPKHALITNVAADASSVSALLAAAPESTAIYNCVNPPHYDKWAVEWPPLASAFLAYAEKTGAVRVTCSNLFG